MFTRGIRWLVSILFLTSFITSVTAPSVVAQDEAWESGDFDVEVTWSAEWDQAEELSTDTLLVLEGTGATGVLRLEESELSAVDRLQYETDHILFMSDDPEMLTGDTWAIAEWNGETSSRVVQVSEIDTGLVIFTLVAAAGDYQNAVISAHENILINGDTVLGARDEADDDFGDDAALIPSINEDGSLTDSERQPDDGDDSDSPEATETPEDDDDAGNEAHLPTEEALGDGVDGSSYTSPSFGYSLEWDDDKWEVAQDGEYSDIAERYDLLQLSGQYGFLTIYAFEDYDGNAENCLEGEAEFNSTDPTIDDWEQAENGDGDLIGGGDEDRAWAVYTLTLLADEDAGFPSDTSVAAYIECRSIEENAVLVAVAFGLRSAYNDHIDDVVDVLDTISLYEDSTSTDDEAEPTAEPDVNDEDSNQLAEVPADSAANRTDSSANEQSGGEYASTQFGFSVDIPEGYQLTSTTVDDTGEQLTLTNGVSEFTIWATDQAGSDSLESCVTWAADQFDQSLQVSVRSDGKAYRGADDLSAFAAFVYPQDGTEYTYFVKCRWLEAGESVLIFTQLVPSDQFSAEQSARRLLENSISLP